MENDHSLSLRVAVFHFALIQFQLILQTIGDAVMIAIERDKRADFFDRGNGIAHGNSCCSRMKHGQIVITVSNDNGILLIDPIMLG